ncbi:MAG: hypothetical protein R3E89_04550 [Thiolinea sp.]
MSGVDCLPLAQQGVPNLELMGKAGVTFWERNRNHNRRQQAVQNDDGISPLLGLGAQYQLTPNTAVRGEWEHTFNTDSDCKTDTINYSIGLLYSTL